MTKTLHINITNKVATYQKRDGVVVCGNSDYQVAFTFDSEWDAQEEKTARFVWNGRHRDVKFSGNTCPVPIVTKASELKVGVYAGELETTTAAVIPCVWSILCQDSSPTELDEKFTSAAEEAANQAKASEEAAAASAAAAKADAEIAKTIAADSVNMEARISRNEKRITNLEQGITPDPFETDDSVAYVKDVPADALPYAEIEKVGGMTRKCANLFDDGILEAIGMEKVGEHEYYSNNTRNQINKVIFTNTSRYTGAFAVSGVLKYEKDGGSGSPGILVEAHYTDGTAQTLKNFSKPAFGVYFDYVCTTDTNKTVDFLDITYGTSLVATSIKDLQIEYGNTATEYEPYFDGLRSAKVTAIVSASENLNDTLLILEAVQELDGYGWGVNRSVYNYICFAIKQFVKRVARLNMGTLNWSVMESGVMFARPNNNTIVQNAKNLGSVDIIPNAVAPHYKASTWTNTLNKKEDKTFCIYGTSSGGILVYDSTYTDPEAFKAAMSGVMLYYELETPEIYEIPDLTADNFIKVEGGGTITFANEHGLAVPSEITYMVKEVTA